MTATVELVGGPGDGRLMAVRGEPLALRLPVARPIRWSDCLPEPGAEPLFATIVYERDPALTWRYLYRRPG